MSTVHLTFGASDIFDFASESSSSKPAVTSDYHDDGMGFDLDAELAMFDEPPAAQRPMMDAPPLDVDGELAGWDDELAQIESEQMSQALEGETRKGRTSAPRASSPGLTFGESEIFGASHASSFRTRLPGHTRESLPALAPARPCHLPPLSAATAEGASVQFGRRSKPRMPSPSAELARGDFGTSSLLGQPLHYLIAEVNELKSREIAVRLQRRYDAQRAVTKTTTSTSTVMWVDKYRPKKFSDLLGEERVHREVMGWLKEWDKCVFRRANPPKKRRYDDQENMPVDPLGRPRERILLLSGPPGYGKTTLAHVVARQAGYKTLEINASDDRSAATVSTRIKNAIEAGTGLASDGKPTCVVIDEIDGASGGGDASFVKSLIRLIQDVPARRKSNTPAKPLRRPIICICNDLYATSLRPLRPFARVIRFRKPQAQFLVKRLREICDRETLSADMRVLASLVEVTTGDVRSCLNTLQFIKSKSTVVTDEAIKSSAVGLKDSGTSLQNVWNDIFIPISAKVRRKTAAIDDGKYISRLVNTISTSGEYERVVQGLFEHYPNLKPLDASLQNLCKVHEWLAYYDRLHGKISENQEFELMGYVPYAIVPWHSHLAAPANNTKITEWPKADYESYQTRTINEEVATTMKNAIPPVLRSLFSSTTTLTELIPLLMRIISPPLRPLNANIVKPAEKAILARLVELMIPLGLSFWQEKSETGQPMMRLEPPIDVFVHYEGKRADDIAASRFAVRQLVAQAIDAEIARRRGSTEAGTSGAAQLQGAYNASKNGKVTGPEAIKDAVATDFFGRKVIKAAVDLVASTEHDVFTEQPKKKFRAIYKFNEGSSSAVRKTIKMSALM